MTVAVFQSGGACEFRNGGVLEWRVFGVAGVGMEGFLNGGAPPW